MTKLAFVDTETTGLDPDLHEIWEVGLVIREDDGTEQEHQWFLPVDLGRADPRALAIGRFRDRYPGAAEEWTWGPSGITDLGEFCFEFARLTRDAHLVGAVISFDEERLRRLLKANGACPEWHYHLITVEALAVGYLRAAAAWRDAEFERRQDDPDLKAWEKALGCLAGHWRRSASSPPWDSGELSRAVGVQPDQFDCHTALGDARWARAIYDAVMGP